MSVDVDELALYLYTVSNKTKRRPELYYSPSLTQQGWGGLLLNIFGDVLQKSRTFSE